MQPQHSDKPDYASEQKQSTPGPKKLTFKVTSLRNLLLGDVCSGVLQRPSAQSLFPAFLSLRLIA